MKRSCETIACLLLLASLGCAQDTDRILFERHLGELHEVEQEIDGAARAAVRELRGETDGKLPPRTEFALLRLDRERCLLVIRMKWLATCHSDWPTVSMPPAVTEAEAGGAGGLLHGRVRGLLLPYLEEDARRIAKEALGLPTQDVEVEQAVVRVGSKK